MIRSLGIVVLCVVVMVAVGKSQAPTQSQPLTSRGVLEARSLQGPSVRRSEDSITAIYRRRNQVGTGIWRSGRRSSR
jgi:hypothetical protein